MEGTMMRGMNTDWTKLMFRGLSRKFTIGFKLAFFTLWAIGMYVMIGVMFNIDNLRNIGINEGAMFVLVPAMFYIACYGAYASAEIEQKEKMQSGVSGNID